MHVACVGTVQHTVSLSSLFALRILRASELVWTELEKTLQLL